MPQRIFILCTCLLLCATVFFRFFQLEERLQFTWDQIENAWMMKNIILDGVRPLVGMQAKASSGFSIGPIYYYLLAPFYWLFHLDPIAGGYFAGMVGVITFMVLVFVSSSLFDKQTAVMAGFIYALSSYIIHFDRVPWPVLFIPLISLLFFYFLIQVSRGQYYYMLGIAFITGFAFNIHFTAVFLPVIFICFLPFIKQTKFFYLWCVSAIVVSLLWISPLIVANLMSKGNYSSHLLSYSQTYFHGLHLRRVIQLIPDNFLQFSAIVNIPILSWLRYLWLPIFCYLLLRHKGKQERNIVILTLLFFAVPLLILSTYSGELSNYYYSLELPIAVLVISWILVWVIKQPSFISKLGIVCFLCIFGVVNSKKFLEDRNPSFHLYRLEAQNNLQIHKDVQFSMGDPISYLYFYYRYRKEGAWPK